MLQVGQCRLSSLMPQQGGAIHDALAEPLNLMLTGGGLMDLHNGTGSGCEVSGPNWESGDGGDGLRDSKRLEAGSVCIGGTEVNLIKVVKAASNNQFN